VRHADAIRRRILCAISLNRTPGYHFPGNFLELSFDQVASADTRLSFETGPHCADAHGEADIGAIAMLADFALGTAVRADLDPATRLATVSMTLELTAAPRTGIISAAARRHGFVGEGYGRLGRSRVAIDAPGGEIGYGSGVFMVLKPPLHVPLHPVPLRKRGEAEPPALAESELTSEELRILRHADAALAQATKAREPFIRHFWGFVPESARGAASCAMTNGPHVGNRVGHAQGGILLGLAATTASAALPATWMLSAIAAAFISPGEGPTLKAQANVVHHGQRLSVVRTQVTRHDGRRVLDVMSTHTQRPAQ
jgi:acyl-coenzyme A thioesterase PaaI-like protein